jgi:glycosyltransferase involved in cell wall biosynthesis
VKRVGILHFSCPPVVGGVESVIASHVRLLRANDHAIRVIAGRGGRFRRDIDVRLIPELAATHPAVLDVNDELRSGAPGLRFDRLTSAIEEALEPALADLDICVIHNALTLHFNLSLAAAIERLTHRRALPPLIAWCHDLSWTNALYTAALHPGEPWALLRRPIAGARYVVVSADRRCELLRLWGDQRPAEGTDPVVIGAGVDVAAKLRLTPAVVDLVRELGALDATPFMLLPVRITKRKNIELAIRVTRELRDIGHAPLLLVTGPPGPHNVRSVDYVDELRHERRRLDVEREVVLLFERRRASGRPWRLTDRAMDDLYQLADLLIFPSAQEGFGIPLIEAGLARLPVFCTDIPPFREISQGAAATFTLDDSAATIARRISDHMSTDQPSKLRRRVLAHYSWDAIYRDQLSPLLEATW